MLPHIKSLVSESFGDHSLFITDSRGHALSHFQSLKEQYSPLIIAGGDGLLNEIINGLTYKPRMILLPIGSGNDFARALKLHGKSLAHILHRSTTGQADEISSDCGEIKYRSKDSLEFSSRQFVSSCGIGLDAMIADLSNRKSILKGLPLYLSCTLKAIRQFEPLEVAVSIDGENVAHGLKHLIAVGNTPSSGGGFHLTPGANISDGIHNLTLADAMKRMQLLSLLPKAINGKHVSDSRVSTYTFKECHIRINRPEHLQTDGEVLGKDIVEVFYRVKPAYHLFLA